MGAGRRKVVVAVARFGTAGEGGVDRYWMGAAVRVRVRIRVKIRVRVRPVDNTVECHVQARHQARHPECNEHSNAKRSYSNQKLSIRNGCG